MIDLGASLRQRDGTYFKGRNLELGESIGGQRP